MHPGARGEGLRGGDPVRSARPSPLIPAHSPAHFQHVPLPFLTPFLFYIV
ncbi:hypothetical protein Bcep1808_6575 [Burkholderia vietnamiensis G4]|uniref:Uncharacterized protein n=1 Tax=Burkholderia vietnamiensis (strain G4 / LMG 22486) TaxID=269482 RepID=A4JT67_BURVG|nr:hypothetical protein Bcep1808_6575 [Burkholderia vietnamiensis G4]